MCSPALAMIIGLVVGLTVTDALGVGGGMRLAGLGRGGTAGDMMRVV